MSEVNYEAAIKHLSTVLPIQPFITHRELIVILELLRSPVEQKTCEPKQEYHRDYYEYCSCHSCSTLRADKPKQEKCKHNWVQRVPEGTSLDDLICIDCGVHVMANDIKQEDLSLAEKFKEADVNCYGYASIAESHYAPIIEKARQEGYDQGSIDVSPMALAKAREEGRKEGIKLAQLAILNIMNDVVTE